MTDTPNTLLLTDDELKTLNDVVRQSKVTASTEELLLIKLGKFNLISIPANFFPTHVMSVRRHAQMLLDKTKKFIIDLGLLQIGLKTKSKRSL